MSREKELYRKNLERLEEKFPKQEIINIKEVANYCGIDQRTAKNLFSFNNNFISKVKFASELS